MEGKKVGHDPHWTQAVIHHVNGSVYEGTIGWGRGRRGEGDSGQVVLAVYKKRKLLLFPWGKIRVWRKSHAQKIVFLGVAKGVWAAS